MLQRFRSSPLWLIGLFILFAEATAGFAAVQVSGWPQAALVVFVIAYSSVVTLIFFAFLAFKPENFYGPGEYGEMLPEHYARGLKGVPSETAQAVTRFESNPLDKEALFSLMDNLLGEEPKQHLILMRRQGNKLDISDTDESGHSHRYEIITRSSGFTVGVFSPRQFLQKLSGTELVDVSGGKDKIMLSERGKAFADWLIDKEKDAETFNSEKGRWGKEQTVAEAMRQRFGESKK